MGLFNVFKLNKNLNITAPVKGKCKDITCCKDMAFSKKLMGDGFIIEPEEDVICSPADGILKMIFPTKHVFGIEMSNGSEILVHIGLDTVNLNGKYFKQIAKVSTKVKSGDPIIEVDLQSLKNLNYNTDVLTIICNESEISKKHLDEPVDVNQVIVEG